MDVDVMSPSKVLTNLQLLDQILRAEDVVKPEIIQQVVKINNRQSRQVTDKHLFMREDLVSKRLESGWGDLVKKSQKSNV